MNKMTRFVFYILIGLSFVSFQSEGKISDVNTTQYAVPGDNVSIEWNFTNPISDLISRIWTFERTGESLANINNKGELTIVKSSLSGIDVVPPATLTLENVDLTYNGTYKFQILATTTGDTSDTSYVTVIVTVAPNVTLCSSSITVNESESITCLCTGQGGNPPATVTWYDKNGQQIGSIGKEENLLNIRNVTRTYNGTYKCVAESHPSAKDEKSVVVTVNFKPNVAINCSSNITVNESDSVRCLCEGKGGYPPANVAWYKNGEMIGGAGYEEKMLTLNNINETKIGIYECVAQSSNLRAKESIRIIVNFKPTVTNLTFSPKVVGIGENVTIECKASGYPAPSYTITLNDTRVLSNQMTYELTNLNSSHRGSIITCTATNILGNDSRSERLPLAVRPNVTINCPSTITVNESDSFRCLCEGKGGYPPANVTWYDKDGDMIGDVGNEKQMLTLNNVNETNNGTYKCVAQSYNLPADKSIKVIVHFKPNVTSLAFSPDIVDVGENVTIECKASGYPAPSYTITLNDTRVLSYQMMYELTNLNASHVGSIITCIATNILGNDSRSERLPVKVRPNVAINCSGTITVYKRDSVRCLCEGKGGYPPANVTWYKDGKMISDAGGGKMISEENMLTLDNIDEAKIGTYTCVAQSYNLQANESIKIIFRDITTNKFGDDAGLSAGAIVGIIIGVLVLLVVVIVLARWYKNKEKDGHSRNVIVNSSNIDPANLYESVNDGSKAGGDNAGGSTSGSPPANANPSAVYASVDKNRKNEPSVTYATLDSLAMQTNASEKRDNEPKREPTEYASINFIDMKGGPSVERR